MTSVSFSWLRSPLLPSISLSLARAIQAKCGRAPLHHPGQGREDVTPHLRKRAAVQGYTTPATRDIGAASVRVRFLPTSDEIKGGQEESIHDNDDTWEGGYILGVQRILNRGLHRHPAGASAGPALFLPAIAGVPNDKGLDRHGQSRVNLAEVMVMCRPIVGGFAENANSQEERRRLWRAVEDIRLGTGKRRPEGGTHLDASRLGNAEAKRGHDSVRNELEFSNRIQLSFLPEDVLKEWLPEGSEVELVKVEKVTDFHLGLNAGRWLQIRMSQICTTSAADAEVSSEKAFEDGKNRVSSQSRTARRNNFESLLNSDLECLEDFFFKHEETGLRLEYRMEAPPADAAYLFEHWGGSGNAGVSGQRILRTKEDMEVPRASKL